ARRGAHGALGPRHARAGGGPREDVSRAVEECPAEHHVGSPVSSGVIWMTWNASPLAMPSITGSSRLTGSRSRPITFRDLQLLLLVVTNGPAQGLLAGPPQDHRMHPTGAGGSWLWMSSRAGPTPAPRRSAGGTATMIAKIDTPRFGSRPEVN